MTNIGKQKCGESTRCEKLDTYLREDKLPIKYHDRYRSFVLAFKTSYGGTKKGGIVLGFCPFCGGKFPSDLYEEFYHLTEHLEDEYGDLDFRKVEREFRSDAWWKKRGL